MTFFQGSETHSIDSKGRVNIPSLMRKAMTPEARETFVLTKGFNNCISAYPLDEWTKVQKILYDKNQFDEENDYVLSVMLMHCHEVTLDSQLRITVPKKLWELAEIDIEKDNKVFILGKMDHIEFWNEKSFNDMVNKKKGSYKSIAAKVLGEKKLLVQDTENQTEKMQMRES
jgi:MraZ protein